MALNSAMSTVHFHPETVPASVLGFFNFTATEADCVPAFVTTTLQKYGLVKEKLAVEEPNKKWIVLDNHECSTHH